MVRKSDPQEPGYRRRKHKDGFRYLDAEGRVVRDPENIARIDDLAIPPAWNDVWICPHDTGHIQATGIDDAGRRQYIYHEAWRRTQDDAKFDRLVDFGMALPALREQVRIDLARDALDEAHVVAVVVRAMELSFTRVGSDSYAQDNASYGMATLTPDHVRSAKGPRVRLSFRGKQGKEVDTTIYDQAVAQVVRACQDLDGERLFTYQQDDGTRGEVHATDVNAYIKEHMGAEFSAKDLRTWAGTVVMAQALHEAGGRAERKQREVVVRDAIKTVAERLNNTVAVCRSSYVHPAVAAAYLDGSFDRRIQGDVPDGALWPEERKTLALLYSYREEQSRKR